MHATSDGHVVVLHDPDVDRTTDGSGPVRTMTLAQLQALDAGWQHRAPDGSHPHRGKGIVVPTLDALLAAHPGVPLNIEIKQDEPAIEAAVLAVLDRHGARRQTLLAAEHSRIGTRIRAAAPDMLTSFSAEEVADFVGRLRENRWEGYVPPAVALQVPPAWDGMEIVTTPFLEAAHRFELEVHVWTVNQPVEMHRLLELGVDGLITDLPAVAMEVMRRRRLR
ncbi:MAG: glycerophosphodiester phosphodiesterase [bacterium]|nr:glycerophosphodiester phosphodiesterase [bacterium]